MGLIVATIKLVLFCLQQPWFVEWDLNVTFNKMLCEINILLLVRLMGMKLCLMWHSMIISLAYEHLFDCSHICSRVCIRICIASHMIEHGVMWNSI